MSSAEIVISAFKVSTGLGECEEKRLWANFRSYIANPFYTDIWYKDKIRYNDNDWHKTFAQEVTVNLNLCKNMILNASEKYLVRRIVGQL